jgi:hypothetical protein
LIATIKQEKMTVHYRLQGFWSLSPGSKKIFVHFCRQLRFEMNVLQLEGQSLIWGKTTMSTSAPWSLFVFVAEIHGCRAALIESKGSSKLFTVIEGENKSKRN